MFEFLAGIHVIRAICAIDVLIHESIHTVLSRNFGVDDWGRLNARFSS